MRTLTKEFLNQKLTTFNNTPVLFHQEDTEGLEVYKWLITFLDSIKQSSEKEFIMSKNLIKNLYEKHDGGLSINDLESNLLINCIIGSLESNYLIGSLIEQIEINED